MDALTEFFRLWRPFSMVALGAALLGYGLVSGMLLVRPQERPFARPYFMSAFGMAIFAFVLAAVERPLLSGGFALVKALVLLVTIGYGVALLRRAWTRPLANRSVRAFVVTCVFAMALPAVPGILGVIAQQEELVEVAASSPREILEALRRSALAVWVPLVAASVGTLFLGISFLMLLFRRATRPPTSSVSEL